MRMSLSARSQRRLRITALIVAVAMCDGKPLLAQPSEGHIDEAQVLATIDSILQRAAGEPETVRRVLHRQAADLRALLLERRAQSWHPAATPLAANSSISGRVTRSDTATGLAGVPVSVWIDTGDQASFVSTATTNAAGDYVVSGLEPGSYLVTTAAGTNGQNFIDEVYGGVTCLPCYTYYVSFDVDYESGTRVVTTSGSTTSGIDFALDPGGMITGTLTRAGTGTPVSGTVSVYARAGWTVASATAAGAYIVRGLPSGRYLVRAEGTDGELSEYYDDVSDPVSATDPTPVDVTAGAATTGIDFVLALGGRIAGTVTRADTGLPLASANVSIYDAAWTRITTALTNASGQYVSPRGLPTGKYAVLASAPDAAADLAARLYRNIDCLATFLYQYSDCLPSSGEAVPVTSPNTTSGIDLALPIGGAISGMVTDGPGGPGVPGIRVSAKAISVFGGTTERTVTTDSDGAFLIRGLPPAGYSVLATGGTGFADLLYDGVHCGACDLRSGQRVDVRAGVTRTGVNFALVRGGAIGGRVTSATTSTGLVATVWAFSAAGERVKSAITAASGDYTITPLPPGSYRVVAIASGHRDQLYDGIPCGSLICSIADGTPVTVNNDTTSTGVDFVLATAGAITGFVKDTAGRPLWGSYVFGHTEGFGWVQVDGSYRLAALTPGTHYIQTGAENVVNEVFDDVPCLGCDPAASAATAVAVTAGSITPGVSFVLDRGGTISGTVMAAGEPLGLASVSFVRSGGIYRGGQTLTRSDGTYWARGLLPAGTYYALATKNGWDTQLYEGRPCHSGTCDPTLGTPVSVVGAGTVTGIDFDLPTQPLSFFTLAPCRAIDTRNEIGGLGGPALGCPGGRNFPVAGTCGVPFDAKALSVNATVSAPSAPGHLRLYAGRTSVPLTSAINFTAAQTRANNAVVPMGVLGEVGIYCGPTGTAHAIVDVNGYFR